MGLRPEGGEGEDWRELALHDNYPTREPAGGQEKHPILKTAPTSFLGVFPKAFKLPRKQLHSQPSPFESEKDLSLPVVDCSNCRCFLITLGPLVAGVCCVP